MSDEQGRKSAFEKILHCSSLFTLHSSLFFAGCAPLNVVVTMDKVPSSYQVKEDKVEEIAVVAKQYEFVPSKIYLKRGRTYDFRITTLDVPHSFAIGGTSINVPVDPGMVASIRLFAARKGKAPFRCAVICGPGNFMQVGEIIVR